MASNSLIFDRLRNCGVKIIPTIKAVRCDERTGSGVLYVTSNRVNYDYIITAKHTLQEDPEVDLNLNAISQIEIFYPEGKEFKPLYSLKKNNIKESLILFKEDIAIIKIPKVNSYEVPQILVSDFPNDNESEFVSWATFAANVESIQNLSFVASDPRYKRYATQNSYKPEHIKGISGAGLFSKKRPCLFGVISSYPNEDFANHTIDLADISFNKINNKLESLHLEILETEESRHKRIIAERVVDLYQAPLNGVILNLETAKKRLKTDLIDDWYHDSLMYVDLLSSEYLFKQFEHNFHETTYQYQKWELFYVPKKKVSHRKALVGAFSDRLLYMALVGELASKLDDAMIPNVFSARYNRYDTHSLILPGVEQWKKMHYKLHDEINLKIDEMNFKYGCLVEIDILNFYDNINLNYLSDKIQRVCTTSNEVNAVGELHKLLINVTNNAVGIPQNSEASSLLASFYLNQVDVLMKSYCPSYYRFMDDIKLFCEDKYEARRLLQILEFELKRINLSINAQKTSIIELNSTDRETKFKHFNLQLALLNRLRNVSDAFAKSESFHSCINLISENITSVDVQNESTESARELNFALSCLRQIVHSDIHLCDSTFTDTMVNAIKALKDSPWITFQVTRILNLIPKSLFKSDFLQEIKPLVLESKYNTYSYQVYHLWLLLAKHKCTDDELEKFANHEIQKNDQTNQPGIAAMIVYICSVNENYSRIISRKINEGHFTNRFFLCRTVLITQRKFDIKTIKKDCIHPSLISAPEFTNKHSERDFVFVPGESDDFDQIIFEPLFSL
jgi:hypothetical protein